MDVLIIDDEQEICILLTHILHRMNLETEYAPTLREGMIKFEALAPHIIFLDINLPDGNGLDYIRNFKRNGSSILVMISASDKPSDKIAAFAEGADYYMQKPFSKELVTNIMNEVTRKKAI